MTPRHHIVTRRLAFWPRDYGNLEQVSVKRVTVIGTGQTLRGDDAAGVEAVRRWAHLYAATSGRAEVTVQYAELPGLGLLELLDGFDAAVIVDAVETTAAAGTVYRLGLDQLDSFGTRSKSAHGWGIAETLMLDQQLNPDRKPIRIRLVGIEAEQMELGRSLSKSIERAMPAACEAIEAEVQAALAGP